MSGPEDTNIHHRLPRSRGGGDEPKNLSRVDSKKHAAWHYFAGNLGVVGLAALINKLYLPMDWRFVAIGSEGFVAAVQLAYWYMAKKEDTREGMDGDKI